MLTTHLSNIDLLLIFIRDRNDSASVDAIFDALKDHLCRALFCHLFSVILTDNGSEFLNPKHIEEHLSDHLFFKVFYCDPGMPQQKPKIENIHTLMSNLAQVDPFCRFHSRRCQFNSFKQQLLLTKKAEQLFKTMTDDNGSEFAGLEACMKGVSEVYFAHPYSSWERGTNEKHNGILRRFIPKGSLLSNTTSSTIPRINQWINNLPRKIHNYLTPSELFSQYISEPITT